MDRAGAAKARSVITVSGPNDKTFSVPVFGRRLDFHDRDFIDTPVCKEAVPEFLATCKAAGFEALELATCDPANAARRLAAEETGTKRALQGYGYGYGMMETTAMPVVAEA